MFERFRAYMDKVDYNMKGLKMERRNAVRKAISYVEWKFPD